ncbi:MAG: Z1 domain-containing protein [bacterium]|nr:Z1 domain-containing protein [bacterium]
MPSTQEFYERLKVSRKDSDDLAGCIKSTVDSLEAQETSAKKPGILLGKIQSGKTRAFIGVIALCFDRGYDIAIVLTKGTKALAEQTYIRLRTDFKEAIDDHQMQIFDILHVPENLIAWELRQKIVMVVKKEKNNLNRTFKALMETYPDLQHKKILIIDDEADYASLSYRRDKETGKIEQGTIGRMIDELRHKVAGSDFLQVTATPYSLYLQPDDSLPESGYTFLPKRPAFTVLLPTYSKYIGGDFYFADDLNPSQVGYYTFEEISVEEMDALKKSDGRRFTLEEVLDTKAIKILRNAVTNFIVGACIRQLQQVNSGEREKYYSFIIHTERARASHTWQTQVVERLVSDFKKIATDNSERLRSFVQEAYRDLGPSIEAGGVALPTIEDVIKKVTEVVKEERIMTTKVNSEIEVRQLLDESGQLKLRAPLNIFVGGQILDRGITVSNLIGFYYGRNPKRFQQDTVLQHSRMYGDRPPEDLAVTRFYTTKNIYDVMKRIHEFDSALREAFENGAHDRGVYFISQDENGQISPCSPNKVLLSNILSLRPFRRFVPYGFQTIAPSNLVKKITKIDQEIENLISAGGSDPVLIPLDAAEKLIEQISETIEFEKGFEFDWKSVRASLYFLSKHSTDTQKRNSVWLLIRKDRDNSRMRQDNLRFFDAPDTSHIEGKIAHEQAQSIPMLMLFKQNGSEEKGWRGSPFWWPVIVAPKNTKISIFAGQIAK